MRIGEGAERLVPPPELARAAPVDIEGKPVTRLDIGPERGELTKPALALLLAAKPQSLPLGGGGAQQIVPLDGSGVGEAECLRIVTRPIAAVLAVEGGIIELEPEPAHLAAPDRLQLLPGSDQGLPGLGERGQR